MTWLSRSISSKDLSPNPDLDEKLQLFADRVIGWQLEIADLVANGDPKSGRPSIAHSGFAVLAILLSYFEMIGKFKAGYCQVDSSGKFFRAGAKDALPHLQSYPPHLVDEMLDRLYKAARCGMYHAGMIGPGVLLSGAPTEAMIFDQQGNLVINPHRLARSLLTHFSGYIRFISDPQNTADRANFEARFDYEAACPQQLAIGSGPYLRPRP